MSSEADYWHFQTWRKNEDVTIVLSGLMEQTEYSYIYCFAEDDESDGMGPSFFRTVQHIISQTHNTGLQINSTAASSMCLFGVQLVKAKDLVPTRCFSTLVLIPAKWW